MDIIAIIGDFFRRQVADRNWRRDNGKTTIPERFLDYPTSDTLEATGVSANLSKKKLKGLVIRYPEVAQSDSGRQILDELAALEAASLLDEKIKSLPTDHVWRKIELPRVEARRIEQRIDKIYGRLDNQTISVILDIIRCPSLGPVVFNEIKTTMVPEQLPFADGYVFVRHILKPGEEIGPDVHPVDEWIIVADGSFSLTIGNDTEKIWHLKNALNVIHIPAGRKHYFAAITEVDYIVAKTA